jgi:hypothetical protein
MSGRGEGDGAYTTPSLVAGSEGPEKSMRIFGDQGLAVRKSCRDFPYGFRTVRMSCPQVPDFMALPTGFEPVLQLAVFPFMAKALPIGSPPLPASRLSAGAEP